MEYFFSETSLASSHVPHNSDTSFHRRPYIMRRKLWHVRRIDIHEIDRITWTVVVIVVKLMFLRERLDDGENCVLGTARWLATRDNNVE